MRIVNTSNVEWSPNASPGGKFSRSGRKISEALGRDRRSTDLNERHPFDLEITRVPPGAASGAYHSHGDQWELYLIVAGSGVVRHADGRTAVGPGDAFIFKPGEPHQMINESEGDLVYHVIADNPIGESCYYPDSNKYAVKSPEYRLMRGEPLDYYDGEE